MKFFLKIALFSLTITSCTTISKNTMNSKSDKTSYTAPSFGRILVNIKGKNHSKDCTLFFKTPNKKLKYSLDNTGEVYFEAENGTVILQKLECNMGWDIFTYNFFDKIPAFVVSLPDNLTYFGTVQIDWDAERKFNTNALIPLLGSSPTYGEGSLKAEASDNLENDLINFKKTYPTMAGRTIDKAVLKFLSL